jgi:outer membrane cobalamin receptor
MHRDAVLAAILLLVTARAPALAQGTSGGIRGRVVSGPDKTPVSMAIVDAVDSGATGAVFHATTDAQGSFEIQSVPPGRYRVHITAIGFTPRWLRAVTITASSIVDLGTVSLMPAPVQLQPLEVAGQRHDVEIAPDRTTYVVRDMPTTQGGTALDVLRNVPAVDVDIDNVVSLRGNTDVVIQLNGRPSPLQPAQLGNYLAQLPAAMVDKVEVIPNPSARENPEGVAGIINIVMKQKPDEARSGGLTVGAGTTGHADIGGNLGYQQGRLTWFGSYGFLRDNRPRRDTIFRQSVAPVSYLDETGLRTQIPLAHTFTGSAGYELGSHDELSTDVDYSTRREAETYGVLYQNFDSTRAPAGSSDRFTRGTNHEFNLDAALAYKHGFAAKGHRLSAELRVERSREGGPSSAIQRTLASSGAPTDTSARETQTSWEHPGVSSVKIDYVRPLSTHVRFETGYKGSLQRFHTTLQTLVFDTTQAAYQPDSTRISNFVYDQNVNAGYGMLDAEVGKFQLQGGLRIEHAATHFHLWTTGARYDNPYSSVFPSALVAYNVDASHQLKLSYSTRIRRPDDTDLLDPTPHYLDPLNISRGNPYLKPEYIRALELGLQRTTDRTTIQLTPFYRHTLDAVRTFRTLDSAGVMTRTFANVASNDAYGADFTIALTGGAARRLRGYAGASGFRQVSNAANLGPGLSAQTYGWTARANVSFRATTTLDVQTLLSYQSPLTVEQGRVAARTRLTIAARQKLLADRLSITLRAIDPFNTSRESATTVDPRFLQVSDRRRVIRGLLISVNWMFGKPQEDHRPNPADVGGDAGPP